MFKEFKKYLKSVRFPKKQETWDISGILGNQRYNFDIRKIDEPQKFTTGTKADKIVFDMPDKWIVLDTQELHTYILKNKVTYLQLEDLISKLEWNIILSKN